MGTIHPESQERQHLDGDNRALSKAASPTNSGRLNPSIVPRLESDVGQDAQLVNALDAKPEDLSSIPGIHKPELSPDHTCLRHAHVGEYTHMKLINAMKSIFS